MGKGGSAIGEAKRRVRPELAVRVPEDWGIRPVPVEHRRLRLFDLAVLWGDLAVSLLVMVAGALLVPALGARDALLAIVVGNVLGALLLALAGIVGSSTGVPTMVALRPALGIRGSYLASGLNVPQRVGWAGLEIIVMAQAARSLSDHYTGFSGYYFWLVFFGVVGTVMAVGGRIVVVRQWLQKFGVWVGMAASVWLTFHLFDAYDVGEIWNRTGGGGYPNFWQGVDLVIALPVSWLPLVCDYNRFARRALTGGIGTYVGYVIANIYSTAVSIQNLLPKVKHAVLAAAVGLVAVLAAVSLDLMGYENFLLLIGGAFVPVFGIFLADYFLVRRRGYEIE